MIHLALNVASFLFLGFVGLCLFGFLFEHVVVPAMDWWDRNTKI